MSKAKLKIGLVCDDSLDPPDGVQQHVITLGRTLTAYGHEVHYLTSETKRRDLPNVHILSRSIKTRFNSNRGNMPLPAQAKKIRTLLAAEQFDVLHIQMPYSPLMAGQVIRAASSHTAIIGTFHIFPESKLVAVATRGLGLWLRRQLRRFDRIISVSPAAQEFAEQAFGVASIVIPNMVDLQRFRLAAPKKPAPKDGLVTILFLGRLVERKGCRNLLEAISHLQQHKLARYPYRVIIGGKGPLKDSLERYVMQQGMSDVVTFTGFVSEEDKAAFLQQADIITLPSTGGESFGISVVEAMASAKGGVLAGDNPGYRSVMSGREAQLFDPHDIAKFAALLADFINSAEKRDAARKWQATHAAQFDVSVVVPKIVSQYNDALRLRSN